MKELKNAYGTCFLDDKNIFYVDGKEKFRNVESVIYMNFKRDTHVYIHFKKGVYKIYSLKEKRVLLDGFNKIVHSVKNYAIVSFNENNKERYYLHHFIDNSKSRDIIKRVNQVILEKDGRTLNHTRSNYLPITLPQKCKDLFLPKEIIEFYAITETNEILVFAPYPYNKPKEFGLVKPVFWKLSKYVKHQKLKELSLKELTDLIVFETEEDRKLFAMVCILYKYKPRSEKVYINNITSVLRTKVISFNQEKHDITLTLDKIVLEDKYGKTEYSYDVYKYNEVYLQNLLSYHKIKFIEPKIRDFAINKLSVEEILTHSDFSGNIELLKKVLYNLNCKPNSKTFYIINNQNHLILIKRQKFVGNIKDALLENKNFEAIIKRYDLNPGIIKEMLNELYPEEYTTLKNNNALKINS